MPELPEVETVVRQLNKVLPGKEFGKVTVLRDKSFREEESVLKAAELVGRRIKEVSRFAKYIVMHLTSPEEEQYVLVHLKMTGQLVYQQPGARDQKLDRVVGGHPSKDWVQELPSSHTRIVAEFGDGSTLYFNDQRVFGWWKVVDKKTVQVLRNTLPPDVIDEAFTVEYLQSQLQRSARAVKLVILDQSYMGGMGNIYANDALYMAGIDPRKPAKELTEDEVKRLHEAMVLVLKKGIEMGGASYSDFVDTSGMGGKYQEHFLVYGREGEACKQCGQVIEKIKLGGRGTYFCPKCQS